MEEVYLPSDSQKRLMDLSRRTLESCVCGRERGEPDVADPHLLTSRYGAFVSLHIGEELRGCIGTCFPKEPLFKIIMEMTEAAASRDYRVPPIGENELPHIRIDISVLSPLWLVDNPLSLQVGKHGLHVAKGGRHGVMLPQVATECGWDMETFLSQACLKAGLPRDSWRSPDIKISSFISLIIEEAR